MMDVRQLVEGKWAWDGARGNTGGAARGVWMGGVCWSSGGEGTEHCSSHGAHLLLVLRATLC